MKSYYRIALAIIAAFVCFEAAAQPTTKDSKGKDFRFVFPPNFHLDDNSIVPPHYFDSLYVFITGPANTQVTVRGTDRNGMTSTKTVNITNPNEVYTLAYWWRPYELVGVNDLQRLNPPNRQDEDISAQSFHIESNQEISVYATSHARTTTDATLILPTDVLGTQYVIASYNSNILNNTVSRTPSQFVVLATHDSTVVQITPRCRTSKETTASFPVYLRQGESYLVQASFNIPEAQSDLSGSQIMSNKPIAVFSGHQRTLVPYTLDESGSRDMLFEQLPSVDTWGKNAILVPVQQPSNTGTPTLNDIYRVYAAFDSTTVTVNGTVVATLNKGTFYQGEVRSPLVIETSRSSMPMYYKKTSGFGNTGQEFPDGDPFMMFLPPTEQYISECTILCPEVIQQGNKEYNQHYITLIVHDNALDSVTIDQSQVARSQFADIPNSPYSYVHLFVTPTSHTVRCSRPMGVFVYGFGPAVSYGYVGGMRFESITIPDPPDTTEPCDRRTLSKGLPNLYYKVNGIDNQRTIVSIDNSNGLCAGDKVLMIQMQGANIITTDNADFGRIEEIGNAGNYEFARVIKVDSQKVTLSAPLKHQYNPTGKVQLVLIPEYTDYTLSKPLSCKAWDGNVGGVLAFSVGGTLRMSSFIDVTGKGFRGGAVANAPVSAPEHTTGYVSSIDSTRFSRKGEGVYGWDNAQHRAGRGAAASGGGGGNNHNAGGGGGSNAGCGGNGGYGFVDYKGNRETTQGIGAYALGFTPDKLFMGGGGGAGHSNENTGTSGGNGGGIVIIQAKEIITDNQLIVSQGESTKNIYYDGIGGGGAGGSVILDTRRIIGSLIVDVRGGSGGSLMQHKDGPGGGGGGGLIGFTMNQVGSNVKQFILGGGGGSNNVSQREGTANGCPGISRTGYILSGDTTIVLSLQDNAENNTTLFPNPAHNYILVSYHLGEVIEITTLLGESIAPNSIKEGEFERIDISSLPNGLYILRTNKDNYPFIINRN